jgi:hypothetical protein
MNTATLFGKDWRRLPAAELQDLIQKIRRAAVRQHLTIEQWKVVDRMRGRAARLREARP